MYLKQVNKILLTSMISICTANVAFASNKTSDIIHEVTSYEESAYGPLKGYIAKKSSTGSKMDLDIKEIPQSVSVITNDMMKTRNTQTIQNTTSYTSSITQIYGENGDTTTNYGYIRGIGQIYKSSFLDGLKLLHTGFLVPNINPYSLERVEVLKGPASVLYGASAPGGLLNLQSKRAHDKNEGEVGITYSSFNNKTIFADINRRINDKISIRVNGNYKKGDSELKESSNKAYSFNPSLLYTINDNTTLDIYTSFTKDQVKGLGITFSGGKATSNIHNSVALNAAGIKSLINYMDPRFLAVPSTYWIGKINQSAQEVNNLNLPADLLIGAANKELLEKENKSITSVFNKVFNDDLSFRSSLRFSKMDGKSNYSNIDFTSMIGSIANLNPDLSKLSFELVKNESTMKSFAMDNSLLYKWDTKNVENSSMIGLDIQYYNFNQTYQNEDKYGFDLKTKKVTNYINNTGLASKENRKMKQVGLYVQNSAKIANKYILSTALRYDKLKETITNELTNTTSKQDDSNVSGRVGFVYLYNDELAPYITYSTSFQANAGADKQGKKFVPSIGKQIEIGLKYKSKNDKTFITLAAFKLDEKDIVSDSRDQRFKVQEKDISIKGIELDITSNPIDNMNLTFSFSKMKGKSLNTQNPKFDGHNLTDIPKFTSSLWSDYTFRNTKIGHLKFGAGVKYIGKSDYIRPDYLDVPLKTQKVYKINDYAMLDVLIATEYNSWNINLNINNILDKKTKLANGSTQARETQGRTFALSAAYKF